MSEEAKAELVKWEGGHQLRAYKDLAGVWTIGAGLTASSGVVNPKQEGTITHARAVELFDSAIKKYEATVNNLVKVELNDNQYGALVSFCYNVGQGAFRNSTLLKKLNAGDYAAVPGEMRKWVMGTVNGKKQRVQGLVNRRDAEIALWNRGAPVLSAHVRATPPSTISAGLSMETVAPAVAAVSGLAGVVSGDGPVQYALAVIMVIAAVTAAVYFINKSRG